MSGQESINAEGLSPSLIKSLEAMIATLRDELEQKTMQEATPLSANQGTV